MKEEHLDAGPGWATVPRGSSSDHVREALRTLAAREEPVWAPV